MMKEIVLKSCKPEEYGDIVVSCRVIENADINAYLATISEERKVLATKIAPVEAKSGQVGEVIHTVLLTEREGKTYIIHEEDGTVGECEIDGQMYTDMVITNIHSTSNEQYVVKADKFIKMYTPNEDGTFTPQPEERELVQVDEDIVFMTCYGQEVLCLKGSYIVIYNAEKNDFNALEQGAMKSTYRVTRPKQKKHS